MLETFEKLNQDLRNASRMLGRREGRYLVDLYYEIQEFRKASTNQTRNNGDSEPNQLLTYVADTMGRLENNIKKLLGDFASSYKIGEWMQSICGIGPVLSAGFLTNLNITKAPTAGHFQSYAGIDPTTVWPSKVDAKAAVIQIVGEEKNRIFDAQTAVNLYGQYAKECRSPVIKDHGAADRLIEKYGQSLVRAVLPTLARCHNRDGIKDVHIADFEKQFDKAAQFYNDLCVEKEIIEHSEDSSPINMGTMRLLANQFGRNPFNLFAAAQKNGKCPTIESTSTALCKQPWNDRLKVLCFKAADCFMKFQNNDKDFYGALYVSRKEYEQKNNESGALAEQATAALHKKNYGADTDAIKWYSGEWVYHAKYNLALASALASAKDKKAVQDVFNALPKRPMLPPAHIHMRALRWVEKIFICHLHHAMYIDYYDKEPPAPYVFKYSEHKHFIPLPNWPFQSDGKSLRELQD